MGKLIFIAKNNIKKHKGEAATLFALIFVAALLLFSSLSLIMSGTNAINECDENYHISDLLAFSTQVTQEDMQETIDGIDGTARCEVFEMIGIAADRYQGDQTSEDASSISFYINDSSDPTYLNAYPEEFIDLQDDEIVIPYMYSVEIPVGTEYHIIVGNHDYEFKVAGYAENVYFANQMCLSGSYVLVSHDVFEEMKAAIDPSLIYTSACCEIEEGTDLEEYELAVQKAFGDGVEIITVDRATMDMAVTAMVNIACSIVLVFTVVLVALTVIIMHFSIKNFIELNTQNIGLLQATGYTAKELRLACVTEQMIIGVFATAAAIGVGILASPVLNSLSGILMGLSGFSGISIPALICTAAGVPFTVLIGALIATSSYKRITVLEALRSGISSHNFKKNHFNLEKSRLPLSLALSGKSIFGAPKKSLFICFIVAVLTFSTCLGFTLYQNWALDTSSMLKMIGFEQSDLQISVPGSDPELMAFLESHENVRKVNTWTTLSSMEVTYLDNSTSLGIDVYSDTTILEDEYIIEGHVPQTPNEIVLTTVEADKIDAHVGDIVNVTAVDGSSVPYTVCGIDQKINNLGNKALMSEAGVLRINPDYEYQNVLVYLNDSSLAKDLKKDWEALYPDYQVVLIEGLIGSTINTLTMSMEAICMIFTIATCFVVILTQMLLTRAQIIRERTDIGVSKALGYTSGELVIRTLMSNLPTIVIGIIAGSLLHIAFSDDAILVGLKAFGISQNDFVTDPVWYVLAAAIILVCAVATALVSSGRISRLEPVAILTEE